MFAGPLAFLRVYGVPWPWTQRLYFALETVRDDALHTAPAALVSGCPQSVYVPRWRPELARWTRHRYLPQRRSYLLLHSQGVLLMKMHSYIVTNRQLHSEVAQGEAASDTGICPVVGHTLQEGVSSSLRSRACHTRVQPHHRRRLRRGAPADSAARGAAAAAGPSRAQRQHATRRWRRHGCCHCDDASAVDGRRDGDVCC
jgi:hypothetical protein